MTIGSSDKARQLNSRARHSGRLILPSEAEAERKRYSSRTQARTNYEEPSKNPPRCLRNILQVPGPLRPHGRLFDRPAQTSLMIVDNTLWQGIEKNSLRIRIQPRDIGIESVTVAKQNIAGALDVKRFSGCGCKRV